MQKRLLLIAAALAAMTASPAAAQPRFEVRTMNFDLWCQEQAKLPPERCDRRTAEDEKTYEDYRNTVERYEIPYLKRKHNEEQLDRTIIHDDPVDNPLSQNPAAQQQLPIDPSQKPSP